MRLLFFFFFFYFFCVFFFFSFFFFFPADSQEGEGLRRISVELSEQSIPR